MLVSSCQKMVEFDIDEIPSQLVLNSLPSDGNPMFVNFAYSRFFLDTASGRSASGVDMKLNVYSPSGSVTNYSPSSQDRSNYFFPYSPTGGDSLSINIRVGNNEVFASTKIPKPIQSENFATAHSWEMGMSSGDTVLNLCFISLDLTDDPDEENYYYIRLQERDSGSYYSDLRQDYDTIDTIYNNLMFLCWNQMLTSSDVMLSSPLLVLPQGFTVYDRIICNDHRLAGSTRSIGIVLPVLVDTNEVRGFKHEFVFHVESIRPERVKYLLDVATATSLTSMFAEPAGIYSNVLINGEQGLGLFSGISHQQFPFTIDPWPYPENMSKVVRTDQFSEIFPQLVELYKSQKQRNKR